MSSVRNAAEAQAHAERRARLQAIRAALLQAGGRPVTLRRGGRAGFEAEDGRIRVVSSARHIAVHFPQAELLSGIRIRHPELGCGVRCVRIRDNQYVPIYELREAFSRALGAEAAGESIPRVAARGRK